MADHGCELAAGGGAVDRQPSCRWMPIPPIYFGYLFLSIKGGSWWQDITSQRYSGQH